MTDILSALNKFTRGLQEVQRDIEGLGQTTSLMQSYSVYAQTLWDPEKQIESFKTVCKDGGDLDLLDLLLGESGVNPSLEDNEAIHLSSRNGHHLVVNRLLQDSRVNP